MTKQFTLYSHSVGPNGWKVAQVLCELGLEFQTVMKEFGSVENGMKTPEFEKINPNGRIPALVDHSNNDLIIWESGAIILYLVKKYDPEHKLYPASLEEQALVDTWFFYQMTGFGPYTGQAIWFKVLTKNQNVEAGDRYVAEVRRMCKILNDQLEKEATGWLVLGKCTIADLSFLQWVRFLYRLKVDVEEEYPAVHKWKEAMLARPAVQASTEGEAWPEL
ncbi:glutathione S-transferase [Lipomyces orientalis]|uniref:Glutathione S-transferase n=1 Tax=Lipomyces orientalis TaxID=1233043 RepID=A0ACC3TQW3_9ASCO